MIVVAGVVTVKAERMADAVQAASEMGVTSRSEPGCTDYRFGIDVDDPHRIHLFEPWASQEDLDRHFATPHFATFGALVFDVVAEDPTFVRYEAVSSGPLFG